MVVGENGVLSRAKDASQKTKAAEINEKTVLEEMENTIKEQTGQGEKWSYTDIDEDGTINVGDVYKVGTESFYVISTDNTTTVTLLAAKCVDTINNKQSDNAGSVAFDSAEPYSNVYEESTIKPLVDSYVTSLHTSVIEGRLMSKDEAEALEEKHGGILYAKNFWLESNEDAVYDHAWFVNGGEGWIKSDDGHNGSVNMNDYLGLRPVIVISKPNN